MRYLLVILSVLIAASAAAQVATITTITLDNPDPSTVGQAVTVNVTVTATAGSPTGNIQVTDNLGATPCNTVGPAGSCNITLTVSGAHVLTANYAAGGGFDASSDTESHGVSVIIGVNTFADDVTVNGNCTLREAVLAANTNSPVDSCPAGSPTIVDVITLTIATYNLTVAGIDDTGAGGDLDITGDTRIFGAGPGSTIIRQATFDRVFHIVGGSVEFNDLSVRNGRMAIGAGIRNAGTLTLNNALVDSNLARTAGSGFSLGGGVYTTGVLTLNNSTVSSNLAATGPAGISRGAGIYNDGGTLTVNNSTLTGNNATSGAIGTSQGGGIYTTGGGSTTLNSTTPSGNTVVTGVNGIAQGPNTYP